MEKKLALEIARCSVFCSLTKEIESSHKCSNIVKVQLNNPKIKEYQLPEPFSGDIYNAPILFISSNPSISHSELYPTGLWPDKMITDFFVNRFKQRNEGNTWVYKNKVLNKNGRSKSSVKYWSSIKKRAEELLGKEAIPGHDYCITEIVHCKSQAEIGVKDAHDTCSNKFLNDIVRLSGAKLIIGVGKVVKNNLNAVPELYGKPIFYLPHPNAFEQKTFIKVIPEKLPEIKNLLEDYNSNAIRDLSIYDLPTDIEVQLFVEKELKKSLETSN